MDALRECFNHIRSREGCCRLCYLSAPLLWMLGSLYITLNSFHFYAHNKEKSDLSSYAVTLGVYTALCAILTTSNTIHICLQLPTSQMAAKFQRFAQGVMLAFFIPLLVVNLLVFVNLAEEEGRDVLRAGEKYMIQCAVVFVMLLFSSLACFYS